MKKYNLKIKATGEIHQNPAKAGLDLISLDSKYTNEYNYNNDESGEFHLCSFRGIDYLPRGCRLVAKTPHTLYNKNQSNLNIKNTTGGLCPHQSGAKLVSLDNNHTNKYNYEHNTVHSMLLMGHKFSHRVPALWLTPKELYNKNQSNLNIKEKATGHPIINPAKAGLDLISLDSKYTNEYNCDNDRVNSYHLKAPFWSLNLATGVEPVAKTPHNYIQKISKSLKIAILPILISSQLVAAGIPVIDAAANAQMTMQNAKEVAEWAKEATRWADTVTHYQKQITAYKDELLSKTGVRDSVGFLSDVKEIYSDFSKSGQNINDFYNDVLKDPSGFLSNKGKDIFNKYTSFDRCNYKWMSEAKKRQCQLDLITYAAQIEQYNQTSNQMNDIGRNLQKLQTKLQQSKDIKESTDIGNAINLEVAKLQVVKGQMDIANANYETQRRIKQDQSLQDYAESFKKGTGTHNLMSTEEAKKILGF